MDWNLPDVELVYPAGTVRPMEYAHGWQEVTDVPQGNTFHREPRLNDCYSRIIVLNRV